MAFGNARGRRDVVAALRLWRWRRDISRAGRRSLADLFEDRADRTPDAPALLCDAGAITWRDHDRAANRVARFARAAGIRRGDVVALLIAHGPALLSAWLGLAKIGAAALLLDGRLGAEGLAFALARAGAGHLLSDRPLAGLALAAADRLDAPPVVWAGGGEAAGAEDLDSALAAEEGSLLPKSVRHDLRGRDLCFLTLAPGPGSLPLPVRISHSRALLLGATLAAALAMRRGDRLCVPLPLCAIGPGPGAFAAAATAGAALCLATGDAAEIWAACRRDHATHLWHDQALVRDLLALPEAQAAHPLRLGIGEALDPAQAAVFRARFGLARLLDCHLDPAANLWLLGGAGPLRLIGSDRETAQPLRGPRGLCIAPPAGEAGEAIGPAAVATGDGGLAHFEGFAGMAAGGWREIRDVRAPGDRWLRSFTLMHRQAEGAVRPSGPLGDVLRWRGETVATAEIAAVLAQCPGIAAALVYGVMVPGCEGRAPMAAVVPEEGFELAALHARLAYDLPAYARPLVLRLLPAAAAGRARDRLAGEGFDPSRIADPLHLDDGAGFVPLDRARHAQLVAGPERMETRK